MAALCSGEEAGHPFPRRDLSRSFLIGWSIDADTLSAWKLSKETLWNLVLEPAVHGALEEITCFKSKSVFASVESNYAFQYLQKCH